MYIWLWVCPQNPTSVECVIYQLFNRCLFSFHKTFYHRTTDSLEILLKGVIEMHMGNKSLIKCLLSFIGLPKPPQSYRPYLSKGGNRKAWGQLFKKRTGDYLSCLLLVPNFPSITHCKRWSKLQFSQFFNSVWEVEKTTITINPSRNLAGKVWEELFEGKRGLTGTSSVQIIFCTWLLPPLEK